jgi:hypothetical protein
MEPAMPPKSPLRLAFVTRLWRWLTTPPVEVAQEFLRRRIRLLLSLLVVFALVLIVIAVLSIEQMQRFLEVQFRGDWRGPAAATIGAAFLVVILSFGLARKGMIRAATLALVTLDVVVSYAFLLLGNNPLYFAFPILAILLACLDGDYPHAARRRNLRRFRVSEQS